MDDLNICKHLRSFAEKLKSFEKSALIFVETNTTKMWSLSM